MTEPLPTGPERDWFDEYLDESLARNQRTTRALTYAVEKEQEAEAKLWQAPNPTSLDIDLDESIPWVIGPLIAPGDCCYFIGKKSEGKTTLVADILWGALAGPEFDDAEGRGTCLDKRWHINREFIPHGSTAIVLNGETFDKKAWARKLAQCALSRGLAPFGKVDREIRSRVEFLNADEVMMRKPHLRHDLHQLGGWIAARGHKLVIIDPVYNFFDPDENSDSAFVNRGLRTLVITLKQAGITTLCIAHPSAIALQKGRKGGPKLEQVYTPFGSTQQGNIMDAAVGVARLDSDQQTVEVLAVKSRRDTNWIPYYDARIRLHFSPGGAGYTSSDLKGSGWEYEDPTGGVVLGEAPRKMLAKLPPTDFEKEHIEEAGIRRQSWTHARDTFFFPQGLLTSEVLPRPGAPLLYHWTDRGLRAKADAERDFPYDKYKPEGEKDA